VVCSDYSIYLESNLGRLARAVHDHQRHQLRNIAELQGWLCVPPSFVTISLYGLVFSALRVYAISGRRLRYAVVVFLLTIVTVGLNIYNVASVTCWGVTVVADMDVCMCGKAQDIIDLDRTLRVVAGSCLIVADCAVLLITWLKTYGIQRALSVLGCKAPLVTLLLRDGTLYFLVKLVLTAVEFGSLSAPLGTDVSWIAQGIRTIIISRFLLNLRQVDDEPAETAARPSNLTTMQFSEHFFSSFEADVDTFGPDVLSDDLCEILEPDAMKIDEHGTDQSGEGLGSGASTGEIVEEARA